MCTGMKKGLETVLESGAATEGDLLDRIFFLSEEDVNKTISNGLISEEEAKEAKELATYAKTEIIKYAAIVDFFSKAVSFAFWAFLLTLLKNWIDTF